MTSHARFDRSQALVPVDISLKTRIERSDEGQHVSFIEVRAMARTSLGQSVEVGRLTAWRALYPNLSQLLLDPDLDAQHIADEFDEISYDSALAVEGILDNRAAMAPRLRSRLAEDRPVGLLYIEQVAVHHEMRGRNLGHAMLRELKAVLAGVAHLACLKAIPIDTPYEAPGDDFTRAGHLSDRDGALALQRYYRSDKVLGFQRPARMAGGSLLAACWEAFPDLPQFSLSTVMPASMLEPVSF